jgi:phytoene dehydrogenase-like protein
MLFQAIHKALIENGGMTWGDERIKRIVVDDGIAKGVELEDGRVIVATKAVLSTIDPHQTFLGLVGEQHLAPDFVDRLSDFKWDNWSLFVVHLALDQEPAFISPETRDAFVHIIGYETMDDLIGHWEAMSEGKLPESAGFNCCFPSLHDPSQAPPGKYTGLISQMAPYSLKEGAERWYNYKFKEERAEQCLTILEKYSPRIKEKILWKSFATPIDIENKFSDMVQGSIKQGAYHPLQMGYLRPNEMCSGYQTPIKNLYIGGASVHPGGLVLFGGGYNAAGVIAEDLGIEKWWPEPEIVTRARQRGLLP